MTVAGILPSYAPRWIRSFNNLWGSVSITLQISINSMTSTRAASYQMTICAIERADYLHRRIRDERDPVHAEAAALKHEMREIGQGTIRQLDWRDFEVLVDLIFAHGGWRRSGVLGKDQARMST